MWLIVALQHNYRYDRLMDYNSNEIAMAQVIYHEARGESREGKIAVGQVVMNRVRSGKYPSSVHGVVWQKKQFSGMKEYRVPAEYLTLARGIMNGNFANLIGKSLYFNNFQRKGCKIRIGHHCFF